MTRLAITTGDKTKDVKNPTFMQAEERVLRYLRAQGKHVADNRKQKTFYDFVVGHAWTLDVKVDTYAIETKRVAFETHIDVYAPQTDEYGETKVWQEAQDGWGRHHGLNYIAYVFASDADEWPLMVIHRQRTLDALLSHLERDMAGNEVEKFVKQDGEYRRAVGYLLDCDWLRRNGCVVEENTV